MELPLTVDYEEYQYIPTVDVAGRPPDQPFHPGN
jgi:hypothetical protein